MIDFRGEAGRAERVEADVLVEVEREAIRADGTMEGDEHLPLLGVADALDGPDQAGPLRHEKLLMVVRVVVGRQHDEDWAAQTTVDVVGDDTFKDRSLKDPIEPALIGVEVVGGHRVRFAIGLRLLCRRDLHAVSVSGRSLCRQADTSLSAPVSEP